MGVEAWRSAVARDPTRAFGLSSLVGKFLSIEDVLEILPEHPIALAQLCRSLSAQESLKDTAIDLLRQLDQSRLFDSARNINDWEIAAWVTDSLGNSEGHEAALVKLASLKPFDVEIRYRLARLLEERGQIPEAIKQLEQAARRTSLPPQVQGYLMQLRKKKAPL